jgi:hypothetical protein
MDGVEGRDGEAPPGVAPGTIEWSSSSLELDDALNKVFTVRAGVDAVAAPLLGIKVQKTLDDMQGRFGWSPRPIADVIGGAWSADGLIRSGEIRIEWASRIEVTAEIAAELTGELDTSILEEQGEATAKRAAAERARDEFLARVRQG